VSIRRPVEPSDTKAVLIKATDHKCCRTCKFRHGLGSTSGPHCDRHYATDLDRDQKIIVCADYEAYDYKGPYWFGVADADKLPACVIAAAKEHFKR